MLGLSTLNLHHWRYRLASPPSMDLVVYAEVHGSRIVPAALSLAHGHMAPRPARAPGRRPAPAGGRSIRGPRNRAARCGQARSRPPARSARDVPLEAGDEFLRRPVVSVSTLLGWS